MKGVTKTFVAVRQADEFRQECGIENGDEERSGQQEAKRILGVNLSVPIGEGKLNEEQRNAEKL